MENKQIEAWAKLYESSVTKDELYETTQEEDVLQNVFASLLTYMAGKGDKIEKDDEWMNYLVNDIQAAMHKKIFKASPEDEENLKAIKAKLYGEEE